MLVIKQFVMVIKKELDMILETLLHIYKSLNETLLIISCSTCYCDPMAHCFWIFLIIAVATTEVALAEYPPCNPPRRPVHGGYSPHKTNYSIGSRINFHCDKGYMLHGATWTDCKWDKQPYWVNSPPVCTYKLKDLFDYWAYTL